MSSREWLKWARCWPTAQFLIYSCSGIKNAVNIRWSMYMKGRQHAGLCTLSRQLYSLIHSAIYRLIKAAFRPHHIMAPLQVELITRIICTSSRHSCSHASSIQSSSWLSSANHYHGQSTSWENYLFNQQEHFFTMFLQCSYKIHLFPKCSSLKINYVRGTDSKLQKLLKSCSSKEKEIFCYDWNVIQCSSYKYSLV